LNYAKSKLEIIQDSIPSVLEQYTFQSNVEIGIMAYGHLIDKAEYPATCTTNNVELVVPLQPAAENPNLENFISITGRGEVPATVALEEAGKVFTQLSPEILNVILLIAEGSDTCAQDPVEIARKLAANKNITIYTIGFMADTKTDIELKEIANQASGKNWFISPYTTDNDLATAELTRVLSLVFDDLLANISDPIPTNTVTPSETASFTLTSIVTSTTATTTTEIPTSTQPAIETSTPIPTEPPPSLPIGNYGILLGVLVIIVVVGLAFGLLFRKSRKTTKPSTETPATEITITADERLEQFTQDLFDAYASIEAKKHYPKYIPLEAVKEEISSKYPPDKFEELLKQARRKYPNNIWIDRDTKHDQIFIKINR
jgi:hypothetical protein